MLILLLLIATVASQDCTLSAIMSKYECRANCIKKYGEDPLTQRSYYNTTTMYCQPKT